MKILFDASNHNLYPIGSDGFTSGTVQMIRGIAAGLAERGHVVHVITNDLQEEQQRSENLWYWPPGFHPTKADVAVQLMHVNPQPNYDADILLLSTFGVDPFLGPEHQWAAQVDGFPVLSAKHGELLRKARPTIDEGKCFATGLGVSLRDYDFDDPTEGLVDGYSLRQGLDPYYCTVPGRMLYANDPSRGLWNVLDIFDRVQAQVPNATLHIAYDFDRNLNTWGWTHSHMAQMLWECKRRIENTEGIVNLGAVTREQIVREELECQVHCMPSHADQDQMHGLTQLECAAAGAALVLSDVAAFPEVFGEGATILPQVGKYIPALERRISADDYAAVIVELMQDSEKWQEESRKARALAEQHTWSACIDRWEAMLAKLREGMCVG